MSRKKKSRGLGSSFSDYLKSEGSYDETSTGAVKRVLAWELEEAMRRAGMTKNEKAKDKQAKDKQAKDKQAKDKQAKDKQAKDKQAESG